MSRWLPAPWASVAVFALWVLLHGFSVGQCLLGAVVGVVLPRVFADGTRRHPRHPARALRLLGVVLLDIVLANLDVARRLLGPEAAIRPGFVWVPLRLREPRAIATLAAIVTMTPGTLSVDVDRRNHRLLVHCFHLDDPAATVASIQSRYEAPLRAIFEGSAA